MATHSSALAWKIHKSIRNQDFNYFNTEIILRSIIEPDEVNEEQTISLI